ncbi:MAG: phage integrase N-terminal SAM-like domain-containing protein [Candidatus Latescibacteria bacterium]|nr:phage integrase N-terminal SAM-like domain-containing protein [Candidatus Latescibacterota bacterium]
MKAIDDELKLRGYSPRTRKAYRGHIRRFIGHITDDPRHVGKEAIKTYLLELIEKRGISRACYNQVFSAIKFLYGQVYYLPGRVQEIARPRREKRLPVVLSRDEVI